MRIFRNITLVAAALLLAAAATAQAGTYVSLQGNFYFEYPEDWLHLDHKIVDKYLLAANAGEPLFEYEAAFSPITQVPFFTGPYFILEVDTATGGFTQKQIDSVLTEMGRLYGKDVKYFPVADFLADMKSNEPSWDAETKTISVVSDIVERGEILKRHLLVHKFYEGGIATFYFYAPDSVFEDAEQIFNNVLASFHYGDVESMLPKENLRVADLDLDEEGKPVRQPDAETTRWLPWALLVVVVVILGYRIARRRRS